MKRRVAPVSRPGAELVAEVAAAGLRLNSPRLAIFLHDRGLTVDDYRTAVREAEWPERKRRLLSLVQQQERRSGPPR